MTVPVEPLPDSLLLRSTFNALENSTSTLKRLSKSVLASSTAYLALLEQVERAEADLFSHLGQLGKWLEAGYGLSGFSIWDDEVGIRKVRLDARRREREEIEVMVEHSLRTVKGELKRNGLAGGNAQAKFEVSRDFPRPLPADGVAKCKAVLPTDIRLPHSKRLFFRLKYPGGTVKLHPRLQSES